MAPRKKSDYSLSAGAGEFVEEEDRESSGSSGETPGRVGSEAEAAMVKRAAGHSQSGKVRAL